MNRFLRTAFFLLIVRPLVLIIVGVNARHLGRLPKKGPAILVANHNSHLDTLVLISLFPLKSLHMIRPVAAADYFLRGRFLSWFSTQMMRIIPINRAGNMPGTDVLAPVSEALDHGDILIFFPEGTRGLPEQRILFRSGIAVLASRHPHVPVVPFFLHGLGKALPKGEAILVPFFCDVFVGESLYWNGDKTKFMEVLQERMEGLAAEGHFPAWE